MKFQTLASSAVLLASAFGAPVPEPAVKRQSCAPVFVVFARGTTELPPLGAVAGPIFAATLASLIPGVHIAAVAYSASIIGYIEGGDPAGISDAEDLAIAYNAQCPDTTIVISGYSQGAQIAHKSLNGLQGTAAFNKVGALVTWGDPYHPQGGDGKPFQYYCNFGDLICDDTDIVLPPHLLYGINGDAAAGAHWVASTLGY